MSQAIEENNRASQEGLRITRDINSEIRDRLNLIESEKDLRSSTLKALKEINKTAEQQVDIQERGKQALTDTAGMLKAQQNFTKNIATLSKNADDLKLKRLQAQRQLNRDIGTMSEDEIQKAREQIRNAKQAERAINDQIQNQKENLAIQDSLVEASQQIANLGSVKLFDSLSAIADAIPGVKNLTKEYQFHQTNHIYYPCIHQFLFFLF